MNKNKTNKIKVAQRASTRIGIMWAFHLLTIPPVASLAYSIKQKYYLPVIAGTGAAIVSVPIAIVDLGFTFFVAPPILSAVLIHQKAAESRRKLDILMPEKADKLLYKLSK